MTARPKFWNFILRWMAHSHGFLDPVKVFANLQRFSKPSEVWVPTELLRSGAVLQARGLMNSQAIQHNLDWIWPYWVQRQFDPTDESFIPRAFNVSHINLTHRNWTAVGLADVDWLPIVDPRGLVTPHYDGWSVDAWILRDNGAHVLPPLLENVTQTLEMQGPVRVVTHCEEGGAGFISQADMVCENGSPVCRVEFEAYSDTKAHFAVVLRPFNPEGVSFVNHIELLPESKGWKVNDREEVRLDPPPERAVFSNYGEGDVFSRILLVSAEEREAACKVGMASAAAVYTLEPGKRLRVTARMPLPPHVGKKTPLDCKGGKEELKSPCALQVPDEKFCFLYEAALRMLVLHSPGDVYPGPYTYKRFWFRDAAYILDATLCAGLTDRVEKTLDRFPSRQSVTGHFLSQDGEWDSNGEALWILDRFCRFTARKPKPEWRNPVLRGARWIHKKRTAQDGSLYAGLLPAGFSAEHLGPNDFYYWDDFWSIGGLRGAARLMKAYGDSEASQEFSDEADDLQRSVERSLQNVQARLGHRALPAAPSRRMDAGAIGSLAAGYPLQLWPENDTRMSATARYLTVHCLLKGGFYQEISHSGINAYLTLHIAQVLLRAGDARFFDVVKAVASLATPTGQWPEAIHPRTGGGCMGDGQHIWAAAEWVLMMRSLFLREEEERNALVLCPGIPAEWLKKGAKLSFGPAPTIYGDITVRVDCGDGKPNVTWDANWHGAEPNVEVRL